MALQTILPHGTELTIEDAIRHGASAFEAHELEFGHGAGSAIDEATWLVLHALGLPPDVPPDYSATLDANAITNCNDILLRRIREREPAAYITGKTWFAGLAFRCDPRALVPRSPFAELITNGFFGLLEPDAVSNVLDLCTGGGCIAIACAYALPGASIDASDLSAEALGLAAENVQDHALQNRVRLVQSDLFEKVPGRYDLIVSNPPYVDAAEIASMSNEYRHEPLIGLASGTDGLDFVTRLLTEAADHLTENGVLIVEVGNSAEALEQAFPELPFLWLEFDMGGGGVFALSAAELRKE